MQHSSLTYCNQATSATRQEAGWPEVRNRMYCFLHPDDYSSNVGGTNKEEEETDEEEEKEEDNEEEQEEEKEEHSDDKIEENVKSEEGDTS